MKNLNLLILFTLLLIVFTSCKDDDGPAPVENPTPGTTTNSVKVNGTETLLTTTCNENSMPQYSLEGIPASTYPKLFIRFVNQAKPTTSGTLSAHEVSVTTGSSGFNVYTTSNVSVNVTVSGNSVSVTLPSTTLKNVNDETITVSGNLTCN